MLAIVAEPDAAHDALVLESVDQVHVQRARDVGVEDGKPICLDLLTVRRQLLEVQLRKGISHIEDSLPVVGGGVPDLGRCRSSRVGVRDRLAH